MSSGQKSSFFYDLQATIEHPDGWRYIVSPYEDSMIKVVYEDDHGSPRTEIGGLWVESARKLAHGLHEVASVVEQQDRDEAVIYPTRLENMERKLGFATGIIESLSDQGVVSPALLDYLRRMPG